MLQTALSNDMAGQLMRGMCVVIICGLSYATLMTLYIVPLMYDILFKKPPLNVDIGSEEDLDDIPDDAAEFLAQANAQAVNSPANKKILMERSMRIFFLQNHQKISQNIGC